MARWNNDKHTQSRCETKVCANHLETSGAAERQEGRGVWRAGGGGRGAFRAVSADGRATIRMQMQRFFIGGCEISLVRATRPQRYARARDPGGRAAI